MIDGAFSGMIDEVLLRASKMFAIAVATPPIQAHLNG
jgi:hypothetical protein